MSVVVHFVMPEGVDDPGRPSGGNVYDRRICDGLARLGWSVREQVGAGGLPDGALVLIDGLLASYAPEVVVPLAQRVRLVVLLHMPVDDERERRALAAAAAVVTTSEWSRRHVLDAYGLHADRVHVAAPGVDRASVPVGSPEGSRLLCVAAVARHKGHDVLVDALEKIADLPWTCMCIGSLNREPAFVDRLIRQTQEHGMADRITFAGPRTGTDLDACYAAADLLVLPSRGESYGMVVTEALARGIPVVATDVQGVPEALGRAPSGSLPGILVPAEDPAALAGALRGWLDSAGLRSALRAAARERRNELTGWEATSMAIAKVLDAHG